LAFVNSLVVFPQGSGLTQGTIFSAAVAEDYPGCRTHGLVITARCDVANDKVRTYNYVPIVTLDDWLHRDGRLILAERLHAETLGALKGALKDGGFSPSILETESPRSVLSTLFPPAAKVGKMAKARERFEDLCSRFELACLGISSDPSDAVCIRVAEAAPRLKDVMLSELVNQRLNGYYFLSCVDPDGEDIGYVALLREIQHMPRGLAHAVAEGLDTARLVEMCSSNPSMRGRLQIESKDLAMPIGLLSSPYIEHLMQSFSLLFGRIGVADPEPSYVTALWSRQLSVVRTSQL
jgi:hypothetical protein